MISSGVPAPAEWAAIARAAAVVRQVRRDGLDGCYGDQALLDTAEGRARHQLEYALRAALAGGVALAELVDAVQAGDPDLDAYDVHQLIDELRSRGDIADLLWPGSPS